MINLNNNINFQKKLKSKINNLKKVKKIKFNLLYKTN